MPHLAPTIRRRRRRPLQRLLMRWRIPLGYVVMAAVLSAAVQMALGSSISF